tara:strand:+ start:335 stop:790 length:456 start_codon:yes stop_codon:yes gene_type:complete
MIKNERSTKKRSRKSLNDLISLYEINYLKLIKLFPIQELEKDINFIIPEGVNNSEIKITIDRNSRHTSKLTLYKSNTIEHIKHMEMEIFVYHDARLAEVRRFNGKRQFWLRNKYPNKNMLTKDEKFQWNIFLSEFLTYSQMHGLSIIKNLH